MAQLEEALRESRGRSDKTIARQLARLGLTQRFSLARVARGQSRLPGKRSRQALALLADASTFLPLPDTDQPALLTPTLADQKQILSRAISYLAVDLRHLPNFFAARTTEQYEEIDPDRRGDSNTPTWRHLAGHRDTVFYRDGREVATAHKRPPALPRDAAQMEVQGTFGPILVTVFKDASHGKVRLGHWEQGPRGPVAVFRYRIPKSESHYDITFESLTPEHLPRIVQHQPTAYHGEIGVDPASGAILRLTLEADPDPSLPFRRSDIAIDYGLTVIGGKDYICPVHSVAIARAWTIAMGLDGQIDGYGDEISTLNQTTFTNYHVFRSNSRILLGNPPRESPQR